MVDASALLWHEQSVLTPPLCMAGAPHLSTHIRMSYNQVLLSPPWEWKGLLLMWMMINWFPYVLFFSYLKYCWNLSYFELLGDTNQHQSFCVIFYICEDGENKNVDCCVILLVGCVPCCVRYHGAQPYRGYNSTHERQANCASKLLSISFPWNWSQNNCSVRRSRRRNQYSFNQYCHVRQICKIFICLFNSFLPGLQSFVSCKERNHTLCWEYSTKPKP